MTAGTYILLWYPNTVYIGQSHCVEDRLKGYARSQGDPLSPRAVERRLAIRQPDISELWEQVPHVHPLAGLMEAVGQQPVSLQARLDESETRTIELFRRDGKFELLNETRGGRGGGATKPRKERRPQGLGPAVKGLAEVRRSRKPR